MIDNKLLISANELARLLNVSSRTVWRLNSTRYAGPKTLEEVEHRLKNGVRV